jgi:hypothetical protein
VRKRSQSRHGDYDDEDDDRADLNRPPLWFSLLVRHPRDCLIGLALFAALATIVVNALFLQPGPHPAPIFAVKASSAPEATGAVALPRPRPAEAEGVRRDTAPARPRTDVISPAQAKNASLAASPNTSTGSGAHSNATPRADAIPNLMAPNSVKVVAVQRALSDFGYGQIKPTGQYDADTRTAIERFERDRQLPVTGQVSDRLVRELAGMTGRTLD